MHPLGLARFYSLDAVASVENIGYVLEEQFWSVPVVNSRGDVIGLIPKHFLIKLIEFHCWYEHPNQVLSLKKEASNETQKDMLFHVDDE